MKFPTTFRGPDGTILDGKECYEKIMRGEVEEPETPPTQPAQNKDGFIYIPSIELYVAKERIALNSDWNEAQEELKNQDSSMLTPYQFREFLKHTKEHDENIYKEITEVRSPWRSEWINARFEQRDNRMYLISENALIENTFQTTEQKLTDFLDKNKLPGISLESWLNSSTPHGLPEKKRAPGDLYFWSPKDGKVAWFDVISDRANLNCSRNPSVRNASLGVRAAKRREEGLLA